MKLNRNIGDAELAFRINKGEKDAYRELFERYAPRILQFANSYLKSKADAEELVQDVFLKLWEKREILDHTKNIKSLIFKMTVNAVYDFIRRKNVESAFKDFVSEVSRESENTTWHKVIFDEMQLNLKNLLEQLPEQQRKIFILSKEDGLTNDEIAEKLSLSKRTVENHLFRAISFLKQHFQKEAVLSLLYFYLFCS